MMWPEMHGAVTHFPIAMLTAAVGFEAAGIVFRKDQWRITALWVLALGAAMALPALCTGYLTAGSLYRLAVWPVTLKAHVASAGTATILGAFALWARARAGEQPRGVAILLMLAAAAAVGATGYFGGKLALG